MAIVTGGASGIGAAIVRDLCGRGAKVAIADLDMSAAQAMVEELGDHTRCRETDVADPQASKSLVEYAVEEFGRLDIAVNNAGISPQQAAIGEADLDDWRKVIGVNLDGVFYGMRYQIPAMLESGGGRIVNMSSILGAVGFAQSASYVAAKHAVNGLTRTAALEYAGQGIRVNSVGPAFIRTPMIEEALEQEQIEGLVGQHPVGRLGEPAEVSTLVCFLHGGYYPVDGGYLAR